MSELKPCPSCLRVAGHHDWCEARSTPPPSESQAVRALRVVLAWYDGAVGDEQLAMALRTGRAAIAELDRMETCRPEDHPLKDSGWFGMPSAGKEDDDTRSSGEDVA